MKVSHEVPLELLEESRSFNDYDYVLLHLKSNEKYWNFYKKSLKEGRQVLLDNSAFELGDAMSNDALAEGVEDLKPTWFVVPDALNDAEKTMSRFESWLKDYGTKYKGSIGVVQGSNIDEMTKCYVYMASHASKIAIPCEIVSTYKEMFDESLPLLQRQWMGRTFFILHLMKEGVWRYDMPHHLLGATQVKEFTNPIYKMKCFDTVDTSNPIVTGIQGLQYEKFGLEEKPKVKLAELLNINLDEHQKETILHNVKTFKEIVG